MRLYFHFNLQRQSLVVHEVAKCLQDTRGWKDFAGVVVAKEGRHHQFLQQQTEVAYQHLDTIEQLEKAALKSEIDADEIKAWEMRLPCPLWHLVVADRNIGRMFVRGGRVLHTDFSKLATHENIARLVCHYLDFYRERLETFRTDAVFMTASASLSTLALARVCQWMEIPFFTLRHTRVLNRHIITRDDPTERFIAVENRFSELLEQQEDPPLGEEARRYYDSFRAAGPEIPGYTVSLSKAHEALRMKSPVRFWGGIGYRFAGAALRWARSWRNADRELRFSNPLEEWWLETQRIVGVRCSRSAYTEPSQARCEPYVYYPMHLNPEASTMILAPNFVNQLVVIEALAKNIPMTHKLYVKEHPSMLGRRPRGFYRAILEYPNVRLISSAEDGIELARRADLVAVITGTAGWESILMGRPVITFGDAFYTWLGASERCDNLSRLGSQIHRLIFGGASLPDEARILLFLTALFECSFPLAAETLWQMDLQPGQLGQQATATAHTIAENLAVAIESDRIGGLATNTDQSQE